MRYIVLPYTFIVSGFKMGGY